MKYFQKAKYHLFLVGIVLLIALTNITPGTYLLGWDNLQTDLNPILGIKRAFFSAWQEYQSFGLPAGMGHAADLIRALFIYLLSLVLPQELLRYTFHFSMILAGALGMFNLLKLLGFDKKKEIFAFTGSLFYIFNFNITQMMFFPFEPFSVFVGALPWLIWIFLKIILHKTTSRDWILFVIINLLATPLGVAQQLFVVYCLFLGVLFLGIFLKNRNFHILKKAVIAASLILVVNSFWLGQQVYFLATNGSVVRESKINQIATSDVLFANRDKGNLQDFLSFEGFFYDRVDQNETPLFTSWKEYRSHPAIIIVLGVLTLFVLIGIFLPSALRLSFTLSFVIVTVALLNNIFPLNEVNELLRENTFINQIFRSPFTKFSIAYALIASYFFTVAISAASSKWSLNLMKVPVISVLFPLLILLSTFPSFTGQNISPAMKVGIPTEYKDVISYFQTADPNSRIGLLPEYTFWGWYHNRWGYDGSGFLWYGIEQPIISRTFDVWSLTSESYFWELKTALEAENPKALERVLQKYNISYLLLDRSLLPIVSNTKGIQYESIEQTLLQSSTISKEREFGSLMLYKVDQNKKVDDFVSVAKDLPNIGPKVTVTNFDSAYLNHGDYATDPTTDYAVFYPFLDFTTQTNLPRKEWRITERGASWNFTRELTFSTQNYESKSASSSAVNLYTSDKAVQFVIPSSTDVTANTISINVPKVALDTFVPANAAISQCSPIDGIIRSQILDDGSLRAITRGGTTGCFSYQDLSLDQRYGYLLKVEHEHNEGQELFFYVLDKTKDQAYVEDRLTTPVSYYIIGSKYNGGLGYAFTFQNTSLPTIDAVNVIKGLSVYMLPYEEIKELSLKKKGQTVKNATFSTQFEARKETYYRYITTLPQTNKNTTLILHQEYHPGWKAYRIDSPSPTLLERYFPYLFAEEVEEHVEVNNWENGWNIPPAEDQSSYILVYTPQYIQYGGFILLGALMCGGLLYLYFHRKEYPRHKKRHSVPQI